MPTYSGNGGSNTLNGSTSADDIYGNGGNDTLNANDGNDSLYGGSGNDQLNGEAGADILYGGSNGDALYGGTGNDTLDGGSGNDSQFGGDGDDTFALTGTFGTDTITGGEAGETGGDMLDASALGSGVTVTFSGGEAGTLTNGTNSVTFSQVEDFTLTGSADSFNASSSAASVEVFGGGGADTITGSSAADTIDGGTGADSLTGGGGDDTFQLSDNFGNDTIAGGSTGESAGDTIDVSNMSSGVTVTFSGSEAGTVTNGTSTATFSDVENFTLSDHADVLNGTASTTTVTADGGAGADTMTGGTAGDELSGGTGYDSLSGGGGADTLNGDIGNDTIDGGTGDDVITAGGSSGATYGGEFVWSSYADGTSVGSGLTETSGGVDVTVTYTDDSTLASAAVDDDQTQYTGGGTYGTDSALLLTGNTGTNSTTTISFAADAGSGVEDEVTDVSFILNDIDQAAWQDVVEILAFDADGNPVPVTITTYSTGGNADSVSGDTITAGNEQNDPNAANGAALVTVAGPVASIQIVYSNGGTSNQFLWVTDIQYTTTASDADDDLVTAGDGNDTVYGGAGSDTILGEADNDSLQGGDGADSLDGGAGADILTGDAGADTLLGGAGADNLSGGADADSLSGGSEDDTIDGGTGNDTADGGTGNDSILGQAGNDSLTGGDGLDSLYGGDDADTLQGDAGDDLLEGGGGADQLSGGADNDQLTGDAGNDTLSGGTGNDTLSGGLDSDQLAGDAGTDLLDGGAGADNLAGGDDADTLLGGDGADTLDGGAGADLLTGGAGADQIDGGTGADTIVADLGADGDVVEGGEADAETDILDLSAWGWSLTNVIYDPMNPENGTVEFLDAMGAVVGTMTFTGIEHVIPCFTPGTLIETAEGPRLVQDLRAGDLIVTRDNGLQPLRWVGSRKLGLVDLIVHPELQPIRIEAGALGPAMPARDMQVSPQHRMLVEGAGPELLFGTEQVLVPATHLQCLPGVAQVLPPRGVTYIHLLFDRHEIVLSDGVWSESFQPALRMVDGMQDAQAAEILAIFPDLPLTETAFPSARLSLKAHEARVLLAA